MIGRWTESQYNIAPKSIQFPLIFSTPFHIANVIVFSENFIS